MSDEQPELRWAPIPPKPTNRRRVWLIVGLSVAAVAIVGILLFMFLPRDGEPNPTASPSSSGSPSASPTSTPGTTTPPAPVPPEPTTPMVTPPPAIDPSIEVFRGQVGPWLDDAMTGLGFVSSSSGQEAVSIVDSLQQDAQRISDAQPPSSIDSQWREGVAAYAQTLADLRSTVEANGDSAGGVESARNAAQNLKSIIGL
ncbi:hypothetical protein [Microbacterium sp. CH12i]|uniref:hypothetical protein n=1 Tax=Microbacterium sp. CH12i TaxID=1479651 RepID=UPI001F2806FD|nr:hypothetical protein [Microbacterium sp. CH12i]